VASAGAGKTVLLAQWATSHPDLDMVWLDIEVTDDDPVHFSQRLLRGLAALDPEFADLVPLVTMHGGGLGLPLLEALGAKLDELPEAVIVLDDLHHLSNSTLIADLGRLVDLLPPQIHVVLSTRIDPPFAWSHHRLRHDMTEIRQADLAFDETDSAQLLERITGAPLTRDSVTALVGRTEGWAAGLQLAGMTLKFHADADAFIAELSGDDRLIADYLSEEVLEAQSEQRRRFLLQVSVLDELNADLVSHITGQSGTQVVLEDLERESMFLVPMDTRRERYRFHQLFRELLRYRLRAENPTAEGRLLGLAAAWHLEHGNVNSAVDYLLRSKDWEAALRVIMTRGPEVFERSQMTTVIRWINEIPEAVRSGRQDVSLLLGALKLSEGQAAGAEDVLQRALSVPDASTAEQACAQSLLAALVQWRSNAEVSVAMAERALELIDRVGDAPIPVIMNLSDARSLQTLALVSGGRAHFLAGNTSAARDWFGRALASAGAAYSVWRISALGSLGLVEAWCGRTGQAESLAEEALTIAQEVGVLAHPSTGDAYLAAALAALERGEPRRAALSLHEGVVRAASNRRTQLSWVGRLELAMVAASEGQTDEAAISTLSTQAELGAPPPAVVSDRLLALHGQLLRLGGHPDRSLGSMADARSGSMPVIFECAAAALTLGQIDLARKFIADLPPAPTPLEPLREVERLVLQAWLSDAEGADDAARGYLEESMALAERHSLVEVFVRTGPKVVQLIARHADLRPGLRDVVLARARQSISPVPGSGMADPLTDREMEILSLLPSRSTNTELAERCYVSVNTIKTHMAHIYRKLDVANRNGAILRAREMGLL
jgi:LuxR family maltose regulon positive regulatory protein